MSDLTLTADAQELVLTIGAESHRLPLADVGHLHRRIDMAVAEGRAQHAAKVRAEEWAKDIAAAKAKHPDGWPMSYGRWGFLNAHGHPECAPLGSAWTVADVVAAAPSDKLWRNYNGRLAHIGGGVGFRCGERVHGVQLEPAGSTRRVCRGCAAGVTP